MTNLLLFAVPANVTTKLNAGFALLTLTLVVFVGLLLRCVSAVCFFFWNGGNYALTQCYSVPSLEAKYRPPAANNSGPTSTGAHFFYFPLQKTNACWGPRPLPVPLGMHNMPIGRGWSAYRPV
jgi:hypothetical protein